jgi:hypothetical protein
MKREKCDIFLLLMMASSSSLTIEGIQDGEWHDEEGDKEISHCQGEQEIIGCIL